MISVIYASLSAFIIIWLSLNVIKIRRTYQVSIGDGSNQLLQTAMAAQINAIEYIPVALLLLFALEYNNANILIIHLAGLSLISGRIIHAKSLLSNNLRGRVLGMQITIFTITSLAIINFFYVPYAKVFNIL